MDAPTPRKSKRVPISLAAWFSALSTSWRLILDTMSKEDSDATGPRLNVPCPVGTLARPEGASCRRCAVTRVLTKALGSAILHCAVASGDARQVARVAK